MAERSELTKRVLPQMTLSSSANPLTAPLRRSAEPTPAGRAAARFRVAGVAIVTGGAGGLGFTASEALLEHGLEGLMIFDVNLGSGAAAAAAEARLAGLRAEYPAARIECLAVDVTDAAAVKEAVAQTARDMGSVDILVTFAGVPCCAHAAELPAADWRRVFDINTTGSFLCAQAVVNVLKDSGRPGSIIFIASISAHRVNYPQPQVAYNASKAATKAMTQSLAAEWARYGVRVNSISPGYMDTVLNEGEGLGAARTIWCDRNPMGRMGSPEELCGVVVLLASRAGKYITGADIVVDGGQSIF